MGGEHHEDGEAVDAHHAGGLTEELIELGTFRLTERLPEDIVLIDVD